MELLKEQVIFIGGKGGVGKSTSAAALAWRFAEAGETTLLISTDPAHNLGDIFDQKIGGEVTKVGEYISALEINPEKETEKYIETVKENIQNTVHSGMMEEVHRQLDTAKASPGADEAALFDKLISIILEERSNFDKLIFDTAPTGHTIRLLSLPELMGVWIEGLLKKRKKTKENYSKLLNDGEPIEDPIYDVLKERQERFSEVREIMLDSEKTAFIFVLNPERLPILETKKALELLEKYQLEVKTLIINKVLPEKADGQFLQQRREYEQKYLLEIRENFQGKKLIHVPLFAHDITSRKELTAFSRNFFDTK